MDKAQIARELEELMAAVRMIESDTFQKFIVKPLRDEEDKLKTAFFSDSLKDAWRKGGKKEGIELFFKILKNIHIDEKNKRFDLDN